MVVDEHHRARSDGDVADSPECQIRVLADVRMKGSGTLLRPRGCPARGSSH